MIVRTKTNRFGSIQIAPQRYRSQGTFLALNYSSFNFMQFLKEETMLAVQ